MESFNQFIEHIFQVINHDKHWSYEIAEMLNGPVVWIFYKHPSQDMIFGERTQIAMIWTCPDGIYLSESFSATSLSLDWYNLDPQIISEFIKKSFDGRTRDYNWN